MPAGIRWTSVGGFIAAIAFFLPWVSISCGRTQIATISAYQAASGTNVGGASIGGETSLWFFLLAAFVCLGIPFLLQSRQLVGLIQILASVAPFGVLAASSSDYQSKYNPTDLGIDVKPAMGFWLTLVGFALVIGGALVNILGREEAK